MIKTIEEKIKSWLLEITEENKEEFTNGTYEFDQTYLDQVNTKWTAIRQFIDNESELIQIYWDCYNSFFPNITNKPEISFEDMP